ncbi:MAG: hypothetical protein D6791_03800 [Chloroflexi bacterium]|nr:MAG: hypothetical protein D6791_03800 [Chloroflexota bacterium]
MDRIVPGCVRSSRRGRRIMTTQALSSWITLAKDALLIRPRPFEEMAFGRATLRPAIAVVLAVGLIIGLIGALAGVGELVRPQPFSVDDFMTQFEESLRFSESFATDPQAEEFMVMYRDSARAFAQAIAKIMELPTPLPGFFGRLLKWVGAWLSAPLALLGKWFFVSIWIMLFARLLGGRGSLLGYLRASSLSALPHVLGAFAFLPAVGGLMALVGSVWGLVVNYRAVQVSHGLSSDRAVLAVLLPYLVLLLLAAILVGLMVGLMLAGIFSGAQT